MEIEVVADSETHWLIYRDDGCVVTQRKFVQQATDSPLDDDEEIICALCRNIMGQA